MPICRGVATASASWYYRSLQKASNGHDGAEPNAQQDGDDRALWARTRKTRSSIRRGAAVALAVGASCLRKHTDKRRGRKRAADRNSHIAHAALHHLVALRIRGGDSDALRLRRAPAPALAPADPAIEAAEAVPAAAGADEPGGAVESAPRDGDDAARPRLRPAVRVRPVGPVLAVVRAVGAAPLARAAAAAGHDVAPAEVLPAPAAGRRPRHGPAGVRQRVHARAAGARARRVPRAQRRGQRAVRREGRRRRRLAAGAADAAADALALLRVAVLGLLRPPAGHGARGHGPRGGQAGLSTFRGATPPVSRDDGGRDGREKG